MYEANGCARTYAYDRYGNRAVVQSAYWCMTQEPWTPQVSSDSAALVEAQFPNNRWTGGTNLSYDLAGNQLSVAGPKTFTYDAENRLATMTQGGTVSYAYDGEGRRVSKTVGTATTRYVYDAFGQLAAEYASPAPTSVPCTTCYLTADHLGSTRLVTDQAGAVVERRDYFPFGEEMPVAGSVRASIAGYPGDAGQALKFTGKERDQESGLDYFGARYMSSTQGRFTSADPFNAADEIGGQEFDDYLGNPQYWNKYAYGLNNPLKYKDSDGELPHAAVGALVGGSIGGALELYSQIRSGQYINWTKVATKTGVGAVVGATAAATFGGSLLFQGGSLALVNAGAGIADRALDNDVSTEALDRTSIVTDAVVGGVAGVVGGVIGARVQGAVQNSTGQKLNERLADHAVRSSAGRSASRQAGVREAQRQVVEHPEAMGRRAAGPGRAAAKAGTTAAAQRAAETLKKRKEEEEQR